LFEQRFRKSRPLGQLDHVEGRRVDKSVELEDREQAASREQQDREEQADRQKER
jgi:hypothetical protein